MGVIYFLHFLKWVEAPPPIGGGGGPNWCAKHIKTIMNVSPAFLGVPKAVANILSAEGKDVAFIRFVFRTQNSAVELFYHLCLFGFKIEGIDEAEIDSFPPNTFTFAEPWLLVC